MDDIPTDTVPNASHDGEDAEAPKASSTFADIIKIEHQLIRVPLESMKKSFRNTSRLLEKEFSFVNVGVRQATEKNITKFDAMKQLESLLARLQGLKRKLEVANQTELQLSQRCRVRVEHLHLMNEEFRENQIKWRREKVDRVLVDYMLRSSFYTSAEKLAESKGIQDLVDIGAFGEARKIVEGLKRRDCGEALAWCHSNKTRLKKTKSKLELQLRIQEFVEMVRAEQRMDAISYSRKHLSPWVASDMGEVQQAMAVLAFKPSTECAPYSELFSERRWRVLEALFQEDFLQLYGMSKRSLLDVHLQAGLAALKTPFSEDSECPRENPLSQAAFRKLAEPLPYAKHVRSKLVCRITKETMDDHNPPLVLPNGFVYSQKAMEDMWKRHQKIVCPRSGDVFSMNQLVKAYVF